MVVGTLHHSKELKMKGFRKKLLCFKALIGWFSPQNILLTLVDKQNFDLHPPFTIMHKICSRKKTMWILT